MTLTGKFRALTAVKRTSDPPAAPEGAEVSPQGGLAQA